MGLAIAAASSEIALDDVKLKLSKTTNVDDPKLESMLVAAEAEYARRIGPLSGTVTQTFDGGRDCLVLASPHVDSLVSAAYSDGTTIDVADLQLDTTTGIVYWRYNTAGRFTPGHRNVTVTYTIATLPADHREVIIADVAGYYEATQRGGSGRPAFAGDADGGYDDAYVGNPVELFPRIQALAASYPTVS